MKLRVLIKVLNKALRRKIIYYLKAVFGNDLQLLFSEMGNENTLVITDQRNLFRGRRTITIDENTPLSEVVEVIKIANRALNAHGKVILGIDPGVRIGVALMCANTLIAWKVCENTPCLIEWIKEICEKLLIKPDEFRVGLGEKWREVISELTKQGMNAIKLVDERDTTKPFLNSCWRKLDKEVQSAIKIALKA